MKERIAEYADESNLICISYTENAQKIVWEKEGEEFFYKKKLYDIVRTDTIRGKVFLYCVSDEKENDLISRNNEAVKNNNTPGKKPGLVKIELPVLFVEVKEYIAVLSSPQQISVVYKSALHYAQSENVSPPPETNPV